MSLFEGLFPTTSGPTSSLFSEDSKFKRQEQERKVVIKQAVSPTANLDKKKRKSVQEGTTQLETAGNGASEQPVKKKARLNNKKVDQALGSTEKSLQPSPAVAEALHSGSSILPGPNKADKAKPKKKKKIETAGIPSAAGKLGTPTVHSKAVKPPNNRSSAQAHAGTIADLSEQGRTHEAAVGTREEDASAVDTEAPESATGAEGVEGAQRAGPAKHRRTEEEKVERLRRTIFVGNLPVKVKAKLIKQAFSQYGTVESVRLRSLPLKDDGKLPRRAAVAAGALDEGGSANAYVVFSSGTSAVHALAHNMREFEGRHIRVDRAAAVSKGIEGGGTQVLYDSARSVFVGNLPFDTKDEELIELFGDGKGGPGSVTAVRVVRDAKTSVGKGIAFVEFSGRPAARMAMSADGRVLRGRPIRVTRVAKSGAAAAAAAEASAAGGSRLRTPFSRGVKVGQNLGAAGPRKGAKTGQVKGTPRPGSQAAWQGMRTKGQKKIVGGFAAKEKEGPGAAAAGATPKGAPRKTADGKPKGKRPSVAARKQNLLSNKKPKKS